MGAESISQISEQSVFPTTVAERGSLGEWNAPKERRWMSSMIGRMESDKFLSPDSTLTGDESILLTQEIFSKLEGDYHNVRELLNAENNPTFTIAQKRIAERNLDKVSALMYFYFDRSANQEMGRALTAGSESVKQFTRGTVFEDIEDHVVNRKIDIPEVRAPLEQVDYLKYDTDFSNEMDRNFLEERVVDGIREFKNQAVLAKGDQRILSQIKMGDKYLKSYLREISRWIGREDEMRADQIIDFAKKRIFNDGMLDQTMVEATGNQELIKQLDIFRHGGQESAAKILVRHVTAGKYESVEQMDAILNENPMLGTDQKMEIEGYKRLLAGYVFEAMEGVNDGEINNAFGSLNVLKIKENLPGALKGLETEVTANVVSDPFLRRQVETILNLDLHGANCNARMIWSELTTKETLLKTLESIYLGILNNKDIAPENNEVYASESKRLVVYLYDRVSYLRDAINEQREIQRAMNGGGRRENSEAELPVDYEGQYKKVRKLLDYVRLSESLPGSLNIMHQEGMLYEWSISEELHPFLKRMIKCERALYYNTLKMKGAGLDFLVNRGASVDSAIEEIHQAGFDLGQDEMDYLFGEESNRVWDPNGEDMGRSDSERESHGYMIRHFWDVIEDAYFGLDVDGRGGKYYQTLKEIMGATEVMEMNPDGVERPKLNSDPNHVGKERMFKRDDNRILEARRFFELIKDQKCVRLWLHGAVKPDTMTTAEWRRVSDWDKWVSLRSSFMGNFFELQQEDSRLYGKDCKCEMYNNYFTDESANRKAIVELFWKWKAVGDGFLTDERADLGLGFAKMAQWATGENAVANPVLAGHPGLSELMLTEANGVDRRRKHKTEGYFTNEFASWATTWVRFLAGKGDYDRKGVFEPLYARDINFGKLDSEKKSIYFFYGTVLPKKPGAVKEHFMTGAYDAKQITSYDYWRKLYDPITKVFLYGQDVFMKWKNGKMSPIHIRNKEHAEESMKYARKLAVEHVIRSALEVNNGLTLADLRAVMYAVTHDDVVKSSSVFDTEENTVRELDSTEGFITADVWNSLIDKNYIKKGIMDARVKRWDIQDLKQLEEQLKLKF